ncbi:inositol 1-4-5-trisphosphate receptor isoform X1, partial [Brachionus plicatilis]
ATSSKALWEVEVARRNACRGGAARWSHLIRFKHLGTGLYIAAEMDDDLTEDSMRSRLRGDITEPVFSLVAVKSENNLSTLFELDDTTTITQQDSFIPNTSYIRLKHSKTKTWVHSTSIPIDKEEEKPIMWKIGSARTKEDREAFQLIPVSTIEVRDLDFANDAAKMLTIYAEKLFRNELGVNDRRALHSLLADLVFFITESENSVNPFEITMNKPNRERQKLMREQNILQQIFKILKFKTDLKENRSSIQ